MTYHEFSGQLKLQFDRWLTACNIDDFDKLKELMLVEQFMTSLPNDVQLYVKDHLPQTVERAAHFADAFALNRATSSVVLPGQIVRGQAQPSNRANFRAPGQQFINRPNRSFEPRAPAASNAKQPVKQNAPLTVKLPNKCIYCGKTNHISDKCYYKPSDLKPNVYFVDRTTDVSQCKTSGYTQIHVKCDDFKNSRSYIENEKDTNVSNPYIMPAVFTSMTNSNNQVYVNCYRDSGASLSFVKRGVLPANYLQDLGQSTELIYMHGGSVVPLYHCCVSVLGEPQRKAVIGVVPESFNMPEGVSFLCGNDLGPVMYCGAVTRSQSKAITNVHTDINANVIDNAVNNSVNNAANNEKDDSVVKDNLITVEANNEIETINIQSVPNDANSIGDDNKIDSCDLTVLFDDDDLTNINSNVLVKLQQSDATLKGCLEQATNIVDNEESAYAFSSTGVLVRRVPDKVNEGRYQDLIVVPYCLRSKILRIAHDIPASGHLGIAKTRDRILRCFVWPNVRKDIRMYCKTCDVCQRVDKTDVKTKAPMIKPPIIDSPFSRVSLDIVGPLPTCKASGSRFILTIMEHALHWPYAVALIDHTAVTVAREVLKYFTMYGLCKNILSDLGTEFTSELFRLFVQYFGVCQLHTTVCHPQTNIVERFHRVLKKMLRSFVEEQPDDWDIGIDLVLFAYREVPIATYGYSPFELLYGRHVQGPLSLVHDNWLENNDVSQHVVDYLLKIRNNMQLAKDVVHAEQAKQQERNERLYNRKSKPLKLKVGDLVLVLANVDGKPLNMKFTGPHKILKQTSEVDYLVEFKGTRKEHRNLHVNMLRKYFVRNEFVNVVQVVDHLSETIDEDIVYRFDEPNEEDMVGDDEDVLAILHPSSVTDETIVSKLSHLTDKEGNDMKQVIEDYKSVFSDKPGIAAIDSHTIILKPDAKPVKRAPYRLAPDQMSKLRTEINNLLADGIVVECESEWSSPTIVLNKPGPEKSIRAIIDYRAANDQFVGDSYPIPNIDMLIAQVGSSAYLTKMDLTRGFYQIPLDKDSQKYSAFVCPFGTYAWTRIPYGLKTSPTKFQKVLNTVLKGLENFCVCYIDDILIFSNNWDEHLNHVAIVLDRLLKFRLKVKLMKCEFGKAIIDFAGHLVGNGQMSP